MTQDKSTKTTSVSSELHYVGSRETIVQNNPVIIDIDGVEIAVIYSDDEFFAVANHCIHQGGPVCEGSVAGFITAKQTGSDWELVYNHDQKVIACPWHGWEFDLTTGESLALPRYSLPTYDIVVEEHDVYILK